MMRRAFITALAAAATPVFARPRKPAAPVLDAVTAIKALRINSGSLEGAYVVAPAGMVNWYFANLGLMGIVQWLSPSDLDLYVRRYLDTYLNFVMPDGTINDYTSAGAVSPDSHDSYAATFLSLAALYVRTSYDYAWQARNTAKLKTIAYNCLTTQVKSNGLTSVFRNQTPSGVGYLMDNCEVYRGLRDFAHMLQYRADPDADYYHQFATGVATGISGLFAGTGYRYADAALNLETSFYPGTTCQVFPQAFGVLEVSNTYTAAYNYLNANSIGWQSGQYDPFPWAVLGYVAAVRGDTLRARSQLATIESRFQSNRAVITINELGWYQRTKDLLK